MCNKIENMLEHFSEEHSVNQFYEIMEASSTTCSIEMEKNMAIVINNGKSETIEQHNNFLSFIRYVICDAIELIITKVKHETDFYIYINGIDRIEKLVARYNVILSLVQKKQNYEQAFVYISDIVKGFNKNILTIVKPESKTGKVYMITSKQTDKIYIGSTFETLHRRMCKHKSKFKCKNDNRSANQIVKFDDCIITQIEEYNNISFEELRKREQEAINTNKDKCINAVSAFTSKDERKARRATLFTCETCGNTYSHANRVRHLRSKRHINA